MAKANLTYLPLAPAVNRAPANDRRRARAADAPLRRPALLASSDAAWRMRSPPPFACIALLIQGGGALGACQAGVYQALAVNVVHLIYRAKNYEGSWKDYDFSLTSIPGALVCRLSRCGSYFAPSGSA